MASVKTSRRSDPPAPVEKLFGGRAIVVRGAREHNLKNVDLTIPRDKLVVFTGLSGSGKSSLAFDTIYAEGQRRYVESLSAYARQFLEMMQKPDVDQIDGLSPAIAIEQKTTSKNPRSTVGTVTEIHDYMRLLWARVGIPYSPATGLPIESQTVSQMVDRVLALPERTRLYLLAPVIRGRKGEYRKEIADFMKRGFQRVKIDGEFYEIADAPALDKKLKHDIEVVVDRLVVQARHGEPPRREFRDGAGAGGRARDRRDRGRASRGRGAPANPVLVQIRLPGLGFHDRGDRAAAVLVQQPVRRLSRLRRPRQPPDGRRRARRARRAAELAQGRDRAVGEIELALLSPDPGGARPALQIPARQALERTAREGARRDPLRLRRRGGAFLLRRRVARLRGAQALRGRDQESRAAPQGNRERVVARGNRALHDRDALRGLPRLSAEAGGARGEDRRQAYRRDLDAFGQGGDRLGARTAGETRRQAQRDRAAHPEGDRRPADLPQRRRPRLSHAVARLGHAVGRREPAHPAGVADRLRPHRRALRARRALDRPAPARQCAAARHAAAPARTRQYRDRGGARRGRDPRRRLCRRHRPGRRRAWRRDHRQGHAGRGQGRPEFAHRRLSLRRALRADPGPAPRRRRRSASCASSARAATI